MSLLETLRTHYQNRNRDEARQAVADGSALHRASAAEIERCAAVAKHYIDFEAAKACYRHLVAHHPDDLRYRNLLAETLTQAGDFDAAKAELCDALARNGAHSRSYFNLSLIHQAEADDPDIRAVSDLLEAGVADPNDQYALRLALGKWLDDAGDHDRAFAQIDAAKKSAPVTYNHEAQAAFFGRIKETFSKQFFAERAGQGDPSAAPVFVTGMPRSGTSLLETLLARKGGAAALGERIEMSLITQKIAEDRNARAGYLDVVAALTEEELQKYGREYCEETSLLAPEADRLVDKNVLNFQRAALIDLLLPNSTIAHVRRNPLDTCLSCYFQTMDPAAFPFIFDLENLGRYYLLYADLMAHWDEVLPGRIEHVDYESIVSDQTALSSLCKKAGLGAEVEQKGAGEDIIATSSAWQARQPITESSVGKWKKYERHLAPLISVLEEGGVRIN
ncbi:tetratricopeptide repeat-containing sulfotransferase family protein [Hyphococcus sp.]|uniref:tetratricopeptide repeat-containing sulfotransferase family protein n=1 Tax=Hyphococcus sp. TaxID=2038636 RepID=UPI0035C72F62